MKTTQRWIDKARLAVFGVVVMVGGAVDAVGAEPGASGSKPTATARDYFTQTADDAAGREWKGGPQELPPLAEITARTPGAFPVYGIYCWGEEFTKAEAEILQIGFRSVRLSGPWSESEAALLTASRENMEVLYTVANSQRRKERKGWRRPHFESDEAFVADYVDTASEFIRKYGPEGELYQGKGLKSPLAVFEILNEPNYHYVIPDREPRAEVLAERAALYGKVLDAVIPRIRAEAPGLAIAAFAAGGGGPIVADVPFIEAVTKAHPGIHARYDILSTHPYMQGAPPEAFKIKKWGPRAMSQNLTTLRALTAADGAPGKRMWFTELGFPLHPDAGGTLVMPPALDKFRVSADIQAAYIVRQYLWALRLGVERVHLMSLHDTDSFNSGIMERHTLVWRPSAHAIRNLITRLPHPRLMGAYSDGEGDTYAYRFQPEHGRTDAGEVVVVWNAVGPATVEIPWKAASARVYDMVGHPREVAAVGGKIRLEVGPYPLFVE